MRVVKSVSVLLLITLCLFFAVYQTSVNNRLNKQVDSFNSELISINRQKMNANSRIAMEKTPEYLLENSISTSHDYSSVVASNI